MSDKKQNTQQDEDVVNDLPKEDTSEKDSDTKDESLDSQSPITANAGPKDFYARHGMDQFNKDKLKYSRNASSRAKEKMSRSQRHGGGNHFGK